MTNKRIRRLNMAKKLLEMDPTARAPEIAAAIHATEKRSRPDPLRPIGDFLRSFKK